MPIKHRLRRTRPESADELTRILFHEWTQPREEGEPLIVVEGGGAEPRHVYVIWDKWQGLSQIDRSEIIMDVIENLTGEHRIDPTSVTVAMGMTPEEARRMGIEAS